MVPRSITPQSLRELHDDELANRIQFASTHYSALQRQPEHSENAPWIGKFSAPFRNTIGPIVEKSTRYKVFDKPWGVFRSIRSESEFSSFKEFFDSHHKTVFLRDLLSLSVAIDFNKEPDGSYTTVGGYEASAKDAFEENAIRQLTDICREFILKTPFYNTAPSLAAVPPRPSKQYDLPTILAKRIAHSLDLNDISQSLRWLGEKGQLKQEKLEEKWDFLAKTGMEVDYSFQGDSIILLDDLYQSGTTLHFVAACLLDAGAGEVYGLSLVKSWRNTDNQ
jgi:hypothetical protein